MRSIYFYNKSSGRFCVKDIEDRSSECYSNKRYFDNFGNIIPLAMQEAGGYGIELPGYRLFNGADEAIMDITNDVYSEENRNLRREESSMISNLPLLFADGHPISLEKITMVQLERFISFMVHCSLGHDTTRIINKPQWWPQDVKFSNPLTRPKKINDNWMANLKKLVFRCYTYHRSEYLLRFCSYLARYPHEELEYVNNWDSTTSLYHKSTGKLLVTFRNENMNYDKKNESSRRTLLSHTATSPGYGNKVKQQNTPMMVQPPCDDIYLCDNCDAEFVGLAKMKEHEKICGEQDHGGSGSRPSTPDLSAIEPEQQQQHQFLEYFKLRSNETEAKPPDVNNTSETDNNIVRRTSRRVRGSLTFARCASIPFSSPAGLVLAKKSKTMTQETQQERLDRIERHVLAPILSNSCRPKWLDTERGYDRWIVTYKPSRDKPTCGYVHQYRFVNSSKSKPALSIQSQLLYAACPPIYAVLTRLNQKQIEKLKQDPSQYQPPTFARKVALTRKAGPACRTRSRQKVRSRSSSISSKRKTPLGNESDPIFVEDDEVGTASTKNNKETALTASTVVKSSPTSNAESIKPFKGKKSRPTSSNEQRSVMLIDLCSSDEEEDRRILPPACDENRDPMNSAESSITRSYFRKASSKHYDAKPYICPAPSPADWLSSNVLNEDRNENYTNKSRTGVLNEYAHLSPVLRSAP